MPSKNLEKVLDKKVRPIVDNAMQKFLGVTIEELSKDITGKLENPLADLQLPPGASFKEAKRRFRQHYLKMLLRINYGNISEAAKQAEIDRRSIHRVVKDAHIDVAKIRKDMQRTYDVRQEAVSNIIAETLDRYKQVLHPEKLQEAYQHVGEVSKTILDQLPEEPFSLKQAEEQFEREFLHQALEENQFNITKTARKIKVRYETLHRKTKRFGLI